MIHSHSDQQYICLTPFRLEGFCALLPILSTMCPLFKPTAIPDIVESQVHRFHKKAKDNTGTEELVASQRTPGVSGVVSHQFS